jgi:hypothetical protein
MEENVVMWQAGLHAHVNQNIKENTVTVILSTFFTDYLLYFWYLLFFSSFAVQGDLPNFCYGILGLQSFPRECEDKDMAAMLDDITKEATEKYPTWRR